MSLQPPAIKTDFESIKEDEELVRLVLDVGQPRLDFGMTEGGGRFDGLIQQPLVSDFARPLVNQFQAVAHAAVPEPKLVGQLKQREISPSDRY